MLTVLKNRTAQVMTACMLAMLSLPAFAAGESTQILAVFDEYKTEAIAVMIGFALVLWALKATGLLKPRG